MLALGGSVCQFVAMHMERRRGTSTRLLPDPQRVRIPVDSGLLKGKIFKVSPSRECHHTNRRVVRLARLPLVAGRSEAFFLSRPADTSATAASSSCDRRTLRHPWVKDSGVSSERGMAAAALKSAAIVACLLSPAEGAVVAAGSVTSVSVQAPLYDARVAADGGCDPAGCEASLTRVCAAQVLWSVGHPLTHPKHVLDAYPLAVS